jgi:hypothetical protein
MNLTYDTYNQAALLKAEAFTDAAGPPAGFGPMNRDFTRMLIAVDQSDSPPASEIVEAFTGMCQDLNAAIARWNEYLDGPTPKPKVVSAKPLACR